MMTIVLWNRVHTLYICKMLLHLVFSTVKREKNCWFIMSSAWSKFIEPNFQARNGVDLKKSHSMMSIWETIFWSFVIIFDGKVPTTIISFKLSSDAHVKEKYYDFKFQIIRFQNRMLKRWSFFSDGENDVMSTTFYLFQAHDEIKIKSMCIHLTKCVLTNAWRRNRYYQIKTRKIIVTQNDVILPLAQ